MTGNMSNVLATRPPASHVFHRVRRRERLRSTFWFIPAIFVPLSGVLAVVMHKVDQAIDTVPSGAPWWVASSLIQRVERTTTNSGDMVTALQPDSMGLG